MGSTPDEKVAAWAAQHHGLFRYEDALRLGLTRRQVPIRVRQGRLDRVGTGVYRLAGAPASADQRILAAVWRAGGVASHRSAAELVGLMDRTRHRPHVMVRRNGAHEFPDAIVHRSQDLEPRDLTSIRRIPCTTATRALVDIGLTITELDLEKALHRGLHKRLTTMELLVETYQRISRRGRHGAGPIGELLRAYDPTMAAAESDLEVVILALLRRFGVRPPVRQHPVTVQGERFRLDLAYPEHRVFLEGDGFGVHGARSSFESDRVRQNLLVVDGWWPLRVTWRMAHHRPAECAESVRRKLQAIERSWNRAPEKT